MVLESNTAFQTVEADSFWNLMGYCNSRVPMVMRPTLYCNIDKLLYHCLFKESTINYSCISQKAPELTKVWILGQHQVKVLSLLSLLIG